MPDPRPPSFNHIKEFTPEGNGFWYWMEVQADSGTKRIHCKIADTALEDKAGVNSIPTVETAEIFFKTFLKGNSVRWPYR